MRLLGFDISRPIKAEAKAANLSAVRDNRGWYSIFESFPGAWQKNIKIDRNLVLSYSAVYSCMTLIASDIAKLRVKLMQQDKSGIWTETTSPSYSPLLRKPNGFQTRIQFWENWILSKLMRGNTYVLKVRDNRQVVTALYVLDPCRVIPLVTDSGDVYYQLSTDNMVGLENDITVPASEIIHDRMNCLFHPLVGTSPIYAAGAAAMQGVNIQNNSANFFGNRSQPGGILVAPGPLSDATAERLKNYWNENFTGENAGKVAVVGDDLKYQQLMMSATDAQLIEQLKWTSQVVCSTFHVPPYKIGVGDLPSYNNVQALNVEYFSQCLQAYIEAAEECLDDGLGIGWAADPSATRYGVEFDVDNLLRMDSVTQMLVLKDSAGILAPNEMRAKLDRTPVDGGDSPMVQQQNFSLAALAKRDAGPDPFALSPPADQRIPDAADDAAEQQVNPPKFFGRYVFKKAA